MTGTGGEAERHQTPHIPGYRIEGVLGRGATGIVYRARQLSVDRPVALKVLHAEAVKSTRLVRRLEREARIAARLSHPGIVSAIDMGRTGAIWWFAMELVEGRSLAARLEHEGRLSEREALRLFLALADALQHAAEHGIVHRDIKPANVLIEANGQPRLVDLGLARVEEDVGLTRTGATLGTPFYVSPEQARDPQSADTRSDIWSLGATMYHAVCGRPPFPGESAAEILTGVLGAPLTDPRVLRADLSRGFALVLRKCLSRDPDRRYFSPRELVEDLERLRECKPPAVKERSLEPVAGAAEERRRVWGIVAGIVVLVGAALLLARPWEDGPSTAPAPAEPTTSPALDALASDLAEDPADLAVLFARWREAPAVGGAVAAERARLGERLHARLEARLFELRRSVREEFDARLADRRFAAAAELIGAGFAGRLAERTGFLPEALPERERLAVERWLAERSGELEEARRLALASVVETLITWTREILWSEVARDVAQGRWGAARDLLAAGPLAYLERAGARPGDLPREELERAVHDLALEMERRRVDLERRFRALDRELAGELRRLAADAEHRVAAGEGEGALASFRSAARASARARGVDLSAWPNGLARTALETYAREERRLAELARDAAGRAAAEAFAAREAEVAPLLAARRYEEVAAFWRGLREDPALALVRDQVELREAEAAELAAYLGTAAEGARALAGTTVELPLGTLVVRGTLEVDGDPLERGMRLILAGSGATRPLELRLRGAEGGAMELGPAAVERLVAAAPGGAEVDGATAALRRALLRYQSGDLAGAGAVLAEADLDEEDALLWDLSLRIEEGLAEARGRREDRARVARERLRSMSWERLARGSREHALRRVKDLLAFQDVLDDEEVWQLREWRRRLEESPGALSLAEIEERFGAEVVERSGLDRVRLVFSCDAPEAGALQRGGWGFDGVGWTASSVMPTISALARASVPTLALRAPLRPERGVTEVRLELEQLFPPTLLAASAAGFHVVFAATPDREGGRCHVGVGELEEVLTAADAGEGVPCAPLRRGASHVIVLRLSQARGTARVELDGEEVGWFTVRSPRDQPNSHSVSLRSIEPVRLRRVELVVPWR